MTKQQKLTGPPLTGDYVAAPSAIGSLLGALGGRYRRPRFSLGEVNWMLEDPRILLGLYFIKGPILAKTRFWLECKDKVLKEFLADGITTFWRKCASSVLTAVEWGFSCGECIFALGNDNRIHFTGYKKLGVKDCRPLTLQGALVGASVQNVPTDVGKRKINLFTPKVLWHVHGREHNPWWGQSRIKGSYLPWIESWEEGGFRDSRRLFFYKYAYAGGQIWHPPGGTPIEAPDGSSVGWQSNKKRAQEMAEKYRNGAVLIWPNTQQDGNYAWRFEPAQMGTPPTGLIEYGKDLRQEMVEGMGVPVELIEPIGTGAYAGRRIPMDAFLSTLHDIACWLIADFDDQVLRPLAERNFGTGLEYNIIPFGIIPRGNKEEAEEGQPPGQQPPPAPPYPGQEQAA